MLTAATPMTLFLSGSFNPSRVETCAAIATWATGLLFVADDRPAVKRSVALALLSSALALWRPISPPGSR